MFWKNLKRRQLAAAGVRFISCLKIKQDLPNCHHKNNFFGAGGAEKVIF
jgi:hypothetical protein